MIQGDPSMGWRARYGAQGTEEVLPGHLGDDSVNVFGGGEAGPVA
jgi:hypothetical protein